MRHTTEAGLLFFPLVRPMMRCIMAGMDRRTVMPLAVAVHAGFAGDFAPHAVLSSRLARPRCLASWPVWPERQLRAFSLQ